MILAEVAMDGVLMLAPDPHSAVQVTAVSTCDFLQIGIFNDTDKKITVEPVKAPGASLSFEVKRNSHGMINVPAKPGLESGFKLGEVEFGPWKWTKPWGCDQTASAIVKGPVAQTAQTVHVDPHPFWYYMWIVGAVLFTIGAGTIVGYRIRREAQLWRERREAKRARPVYPSHRRAVDPMRERVQRRVKSRIKRELVVRILRSRSKV